MLVKVNTHTLLSLSLSLTLFFSSIHINELSKTKVGAASTALAQRVGGK